MDREWTIDEWNNWWKDPGSRPEGDEMGGEGEQDGAEEDEYDFNAPEISEMLIKHKGRLFGEGESKRVFVTFCGKALEMKWLCEQGMEVVGNDCSDLALEGFMTDHQFEYEKQQTDKFKVFKAKAAKIFLFAGDFFDVKPDTVGGKFDAVWDSASFQSACVSERQRYVDTVASLMKPKAKYLLSVTDFKDLRTWKGPPYQITDEIIEETFGRLMTWEVIDCNPWGPYVERIVYLELK